MRNLARSIDELYAQLNNTTTVWPVTHETCEAAVELLVAAPRLVHQLRSTFPDLDETGMQWIVPEESPLPDGSRVRGIGVVRGAVDQPVLGVKIRCMTT